MRLPGCGGPPSWAYRHSTPQTRNGPEGVLKLFPPLPWRRLVDVSRRVRAGRLPFGGAHQSRHSNLCFGPRRLPRVREERRRAKCWTSPEGILSQQLCTLLARGARHPVPVTRPRTERIERTRLEDLQRHLLSSCSIIPRDVAHRWPTIWAARILPLNYTDTPFSLDRHGTWYNKDMASAFESMFALFFRSYSSCL